MVVAVAIVRVAMDAMVNASAGIAVNAVSAKIVRRDNLVSKDKTARHAVNATSAIARKVASRVTTKPPISQHRFKPDMNWRRSHKSHASSSNRERRLKPSQSSKVKKAKAVDVVAVVAVVAVDVTAIARDASRVPNKIAPRCCPAWKIQRAAISLCNPL